MKQLMMVRPQKLPPVDCTVAVLSGKTSDTNVGRCAAINHTLSGYNQLLLGYPLQTPMPFFHQVMLAQYAFQRPNWQKAACICHRVTSWQCLSHVHTVE